MKLSTRKAVKVLAEEGIDTYQHKFSELRALNA
jgi:hypothetical protein